MSRMSIFPGEGSVATVKSRFSSRMRVVISSLNPSEVIGSSGFLFHVSWWSMIMEYVRGAIFKQYSHEEVDGNLALTIYQLEEFLQRISPPPPHVCIGSM